MKELTKEFEKEAEKNSVNRRVYEHILKRLEAAPEEVIKNIKDKKLSIEGAISKMRDEARKNMSGGCGVLTDEEGFNIIDEYFGLKKETEAAEETKPVSLFDIM